MQVFIGLTICLLAAAVVLATFRNGRRIGEVYQKVKEIDHAVNGKAPGQSSISQDVMTIKDKQELDAPSSSPVEDEALLPLVRQLVKDVEELKNR